MISEIEVQREIEADQSEHDVNQMTLQVIKAVAVLQRQRRTGGKDHQYPDDEQRARQPQKNEIRVLFHLLICPGRMVKAPSPILYLLSYSYQVALSLWERGKRIKAPLKI